MTKTKVYVLSVTDGTGWWVYGAYQNYGTAMADAMNFCDRALYGDERNYKIEEMEIIRA